MANSHDDGAYRTVDIMYRNKQTNYFFFGAVANLAHRDLANDVLALGVFRSTLCRVISWCRLTCWLLEWSFDGTPDFLGSQVLSLTSLASLLGKVLPGPLPFHPPLVHHFRHYLQP